MAVLEKKRIEIRPAEVEAPAVRKPRLPWLIGVTAVAALIAVGTVAVLFGDGRVGVDEGAGEVEPLFTYEELVLIDLANRGLIPRQAVDWEMVELKRLVNQGLVPRQALEPGRTVAAMPEPLFTNEEIVLIDLANRGLIPRQAVDWEIVELKRLVNQGLIPREALP
jgi:hypothetical protein